MVREAVRGWLTNRDRDVQRQHEMQILDKLSQIRRRLKEQHGVYQGDLLGDARAERDDDIERVWRGEM
jgi:hypothetical protein